MKNKSNKHRGWSIHHGDYEPDNSLRDMELRIQKKKFQVKVIKSVLFIVGAAVILAILFSL